MMPSFRENLKRLRLERGLTLQGLATLAGLSMSGLTQMESGAIPDPRVSTVLALAKALGVGVEQILAGEEPAGHKRPAPRPKPPTKRGPRPDAR